MKPELESALKRLLEKLTLPSAAKTSKVMDVLNSPFVITLVGGTLIAIISATLTQCNAINARDREIALEKLHRKQNFVDTFASKIEQYLTLTFGLRKREIFLVEWQKVPERAAARFSDGRTFEETRAKWDEDKRYWIEHSPGTTPLAVIYTAKILFPKAEIVDKLNQLEKTVDLYGSATELEDLVTAYNQVLVDLEVVISVLAKESYEK
jgi:hypothetical protein